MSDVVTKNLFRSLVRLLPGTLAGQFILLAVSPVLTRLYTPADFGVLAFYTNMLGVLAVVASLRLELAIPSAPNGRTATSLVTLSLFAGIIVSLLSVVPAFLLLRSADPIAPHSLSSFWWTIPLSILLLSANNSLISWSLFYRRHRNVSRSRIFQGIQGALVQILYPAFLAGPGGLILGNMLSQGGGVVQLGVAYFRRFLAEPVSASRLFSLLAEYRSFPISAMPAALISRTAIHAPPIAFLFLYGPELAGLLVLTQRVVGLPTLLIGRAVAAPFQQSLGRASRRGLSSRPSLTLLIGILCVPAFSMSVAILAFGPWLFSVAFGQEWQQAGVFAQILTPMFFMQLLASPVAQAQAVVGAGSRQLALEALRLAIVILSIAIPFFWSFDFIAALFVYSIAMLFIYAIYIISAFSVSGKTYLVDRDDPQGSDQ